MSSEPEFDHYAVTYEELLQDPLRDGFSGGDSTYFHSRKRDVIVEYFRSRARETRNLAYLDLGCGKGELLTLMREDFAKVCGCDPSSGMMTAGGLRDKGVETRVQNDPSRIPFDAGSFDFVTAVCVFHHVPPAGRPSLIHEMSRVLKPGGVLSIIEHNPYNPVTQLIVSRTPVDADASLLSAGLTRRLLREQGFDMASTKYFLYVPERIYGSVGWIEKHIGSHIALGGQYAVFATKPPEHS